MNDTVSPFRALSISFRRECVTALRNRSDLYNPLVFFLSMVMFVPLGVSPDAKILGPIAPGIIWIIALLSVLLSLDKVFQSDFEDGCLEQIFLSGQSVYWVVLAKMLAHWFFTGLPLMLLSPILGLMMALPSQGFLALMTSLFFGTGSLCFIGAMGAALTVSLRRGGLLISLIIIPLYVPVLIFGTSCIRQAVMYDPFVGPMAIMAAIWMAALMLAPLACMGALRISLSN